MAAKARTARGKAGRNPSGVPRKSIAVTLKGGPEWKAWLEGLADHCRTDVSKVIDQALIQYAKSEGYPAEAPRR